MSSLFAALSSSAGALSAYQTVLDAVQNNVTNASTPGYARQSVSLELVPATANSAALCGSASSFTPFSPWSRLSCFCLSLV